uniref:CD99 antigen-like protein 2 n=1 Tax=Gouania willdenowi TaxID=441366 RepID=A0A8C5G8I6_GOUWI
MARCSLNALCLLLALLLPLHVISQDPFDLSDALDPSAPTTKPGAQTVPTGGDSLTTPITKSPPKIVPKVPATTKAPVKPKTKPGGFSDLDLIDVGKDDSYKPDKGKGGRPSGDDQINQYDDNTETKAEVGTIAGIVSAVAMALVGAVSSYISYQKKKLCFGIQQSLNTDMVKAENPEAVVATEPQVQQTLLEPPNAEPQTEENAV